MRGLGEFKLACQERRFLLASERVDCVFKGKSDEPIRRTISRLCCDGHGLRLVYIARGHDGLKTNA